MFQFFQLLPTLTLIELVEMSTQADKLPSAVSGGQQRVTIARAAGLSIRERLAYQG